MKSITNIKERNIGLDFLKAWMAFEVVMCHYGHGSQEFVYTHFFAYFRSITVPVFMMISFMFISNTLFDNRNGKEILLRRLERIYTPLLFWALFYFVVYNSIAYIWDNMDFCCSVESLVWQLLLGHGNNPAMWFNVNLAVLTVVFYLIHRYIPKYSIYIYILLGIISIIFQYSGYNTCFLSLGLTVSHPIGRLFETLPYATIGVLLFMSNKHNRIEWVLGTLIISIFIVIGYDFKQYSYGHAGITVMLISYFLLLIFKYLPFYKLPSQLLSLIRFVAKYSMGIYCVHLLVGRLFLALGLYITPFYNSVLIYIFSLLISYLLSLIPLKAIAKSVS